MSYGYSQDFQIKILASMLRVPSFMPMHVDVLEPKFFDYDSLIILSRMILDYYLHYKLVPSKDSVELIMNEYLTKFKLSENISSLIRAALEDSYNISLSDYNHIRDTVAKFGRDQAFKSAWAESGRIIDKGLDMDGARNLMQEAMKVGTLVDGFGMEIMESLNTVPDVMSSDSRYNPYGKVPLGYYFIDTHIMGGLGAGEYCVIAGGSGQGKSMLALNFTIGGPSKPGPLKLGLSTFLISNEMRENDLLARYASRLSNIPLIELVSNPTQFNECVETIKSEYKGRIHVKYIPPGHKVGHVRSYVSKLVARGGEKPGLIVYDYISHNRTLPTYYSGNSYLDLGMVVNEFIEIGNDYGCPVILVAQLQRAGYYSEFSGSESIGESWKIITDADVAMIINQSREMKRNGIMDILIDKARRGIDQVMIRFKVDYYRMFMEEQGVVNSGSGS